MTENGRPTTWQSVFRGPQIFTIVLVASVAGVAFASGLPLVGALALVVLVGEVLLMKMKVWSKYARQDRRDRDAG